MKEVQLPQSRAQRMQDWVFTTIPGTGILAAFMVVTTFMFHSTAYTVMICLTAGFLLGSMFNRRGDK